MRTYILQSGSIRKENGGPDGYISTYYRKHPKTSIPGILSIHIKEDKYSKTAILV